MTGGSEQVLIRKELLADLRRMMQDQGYTSLEDYVNDNLTACMACSTRTEPTSADLQFEVEMLRLRIKDLEHTIGKKDEEITVLLKLWEHCKVEGEPAPALDIPPDLEDRIETIMRNWYYDAERKDHSGAN